MKKSLLMSAALMAASMAAMAQNGLTILPNPTGMYTMGFAISADGKYVAGRYTDNVTVFVSDWKEGKTATATTDEAEEFSFLNNVSNHGTGFGYVGTLAANLNIDGTVQHFGDSAIVNDGTNDDGLFVGNEYHNDLMYTHACLWSTDGTRTMLPEPTDEWAGFTVNGSSAELISADKQVIVGYMIDDFYTCPLLIWHLNRDTQTYSADPSLTKKYFAAGWDMEHPYTVFMPTGLSNNGRWIALSVTDQDYNSGIARYDLVNDTLEVCMGEGGRTTLQSTGIADDGTMIGYEANGAAIYWKAGEAQYTTLAEAFPGATKLAEFDEQGEHGAFGISADGRYIVGQGYLLPEDPEAYYNDLFTYVLDTEDEGAATAIDAVENHTPAAASTTVTARYNLRGQRVSAADRGIQLVRMADGRVRKQIVK